MKDDTTMQPGFDLTADPNDGVEARWRAVVARDKGADGAFVYGVVTTGIYCVPSCNARTPKRSNVRFFATAEAAEESGFRPCKRCKGQAQRDDRDSQLIAAACRRLEQAEQPPRMAELASDLGLSVAYFHRLFRRITGVTPKAYYESLRSARDRKMLEDGASVTDALYAAGYENSSRFYEGAAKRLGMTPGAYKIGARGEAIRFAVGACSLGALLVAASARGICAIDLGDDPQGLVEDLQKRFSGADLVGDDPDFAAWLSQVAGFIDDPSQGLGLPLDIRGTAFQEQVWQVLKAIPVGATVTYTDIAERLGRPKSVRAVANACGANRLAVAIPCHRVVRTDGSLSGYRWGVARKRTLLAREAQSRVRR